MESRSEIISGLEGLSIWGGDCNMLNEAQSKVRDSEGKWMGNQCALLIVWPGQDLECMILHMREILLSSFYWWGNWVSEEWNNLPSLYKANFPPPHHMLSPMMLVTQNPCPLVFPAAFTAQAWGTPMFKSRKMKRTQRQARESHVLKVKGIKWFKKETPLHLNGDDRSSQTWTENV